jgi:sodium-dependent dicarboxylate transporter 2/3/5
MDWSTAQRLPWGVLLLIGGGFAIAGAFGETGLSKALGDSFADIASGWPTWLLVAAVVLMLTFVTELTTNVATVSVFLPVLAAASVHQGIEVDPRIIMVPATIATSCAFMLPIATPPNAIVFGSGHVRISQMAKYGIVLNLVSVALITLATFFLFAPQWNISPDVLPEWAVPPSK